jgi:hypothetical protein
MFDPRCIPTGDVTEGAGWLKLAGFTGCDASGARPGWSAFLPGALHHEISVKCPFKTFHFALCAC